MCGDAWRLGVWAFLASIEICIQSINVDTAVFIMHSTCTLDLPV